MTVTEWLDDIKAAKKREKKFRDKGEKILDIYEGEKETPFNILYSNTEVIFPSVYSSIPRPAISPRHDNNDPLTEAAASACNKMIEYLLDTDLDGHDNFNDSLETAVLSGLLPGRGVNVVEYDADDEVNIEGAYLESKKWDRVYFGYALKWSEVPWVAYELFLDIDEAKELFGNDIAKKVEFSKEKGEDNEERDSKKTGHFYQIWEKSSKTVFYISATYSDGTLKEDDDPLGLSGFFNCPKPIQFVKKPYNLVPTALYTLYENQAEELNKITLRLKYVIAAIKAVYLFDGSLGDDIESLVNESDGGMIPTDKASSLIDGGLSKAVWAMPIGELMTVAQQLYTAREAAKRVIYEIMGISDIIRGQSMASETLGAQKIKEAWGTLRIKRLQKEVQRYALDSMKLILEVAIQKFSEKSWSRMTGLPFSTEKQVKMAELIVKSGQQDPNFMQAQQVLQAPKWSDILKSLKDNTSRSYKIDIETNSTLDVEATEDKKMIGDFMNAFSQFMNGMMPMIESKIMPFGAAKAMMLAIVKRYRFGREVEDEIKAMQPPQSDPKTQQAQQELQKEKEGLDKEKEAVTQQKQLLFENSQKKADEIMQKEDALDEKVRNETDDLERQQRKLDEDIQQFAFDKRLAELEIENEKLTARMDNEIADAEAKLSLKEQIIAHQRDIQSLLDKHASHVEKMVNNADLRTQVPEGS